MFALKRSRRARLDVVCGAACLVASTCVARGASACAVCGAGDPTISTLGTEKTFSGRLRLSAETRFGGATLGPDDDRLSVFESRLDLTAGYAPNDWLYLSASLPLLHRVVTDPDMEQKASNTLGDVEVRARGSFWSRDKGSTSQQVSFLAGVKLPTAPTAYDARGVALPPEIQPGLGAIAPLVGIVYTARVHTWSMFAATTIYAPYAVRSDAHAGDSLRVTFAAQYQGTKYLAPRVGVATRLDESSESTGPYANDSGGFVGYATTELVSSPIDDLVLTIGAFFPAVQALQGQHRETPVVSAGVLVDL